MKNNAIILFYTFIILLVGSCTVAKDYEEANRVNSIRSFTKFQEEHPHSKYKKEVEKKLYILQDEEAWYKAQIENTIKAYEEYLSKYEEGNYRDGAQAKIKKLEYDSLASVAWKNACIANTISAFESFISLYPLASQVSEAALKIKSLKDDIAWREAERFNTPEAYTNYMSDFPQGNHYQTATIRKRNIIDESLRPIWNKVLEQNTIEGFTEFYNKYPDNSYTNLALEKIRMLEEKKWEVALRTNSIKGYKDFIKNNPRHPKLLDAEKKIIDLEVDQIFKGDHGKLPPLSKNSYSSSTKTSSNIDIFNNTPYVLTLRYSGSESVKVEIPAGKHGYAILRNGNYRIAASVNAPDVSNYAGVEELQGGDYEAEYYIIYENSKYRKY